MAPSWRVALLWRPGWQSNDLRTVVDRLATVTRGERWIEDGNIDPGEQDLCQLAGRADVLVCLDPPRRVAVTRVAPRSSRRIVTLEPCFNGNRESVRRAFLGRGAFVRYAWRSHAVCRGTHARALTSLPHVRLLSARAVDAWPDTAGARVTPPP